MFVESPSHPTHIQIDVCLCYHRHDSTGFDFGAAKEGNRCGKAGRKGKEEKEKKEVDSHQIYIHAKIYFFKFQQESKR